MDWLREHKTHKRNQNSNDAAPAAITTQQPQRRTQQQGEQHLHQQPHCAFRRPCRNCMCHRPRRFVRLLGFRIDHFFSSLLRPSTFSDRNSRLDTQIRFRDIPDSWSSSIPNVPPQVYSTTRVSVSQMPPPKYPSQLELQYPKCVTPDIPES